jgi:UDP-glucose 6-dehydrogenase
MVKVYDPRWKGTIKGVTVSDSLAKCLAGADLAVIMTPWPEFQYPDFSGMRRKVVFDCWRTMDVNVLGKQGVGYYALGVNR